MKSILRVNGTELVVENVAPNSTEFNESAYEELKNIFGEEMSFQLHPLPRFGIKLDSADNYNTGVLTGSIEGECACAIHVISDDTNISTIPAFIVFRK